MSKTRFTLPESTDLAKVGEQLKTAYTRKNTQRLDFFTLYDNFVKHAPREQQIALLIFELELIEQTYRAISPEERKGYIYNTGSQVYTELHKIMQDVSLDDRLIQIYGLRYYVANKMPLEMVKSATWADKDKLLANIDEVIRQIVQVKEKRQIERLLHTMPDLAALKNNMQEISKSYHDTKAGKKKSSKREAALVFVDFISQTCDEIFGVSYRDKTREENEKDLAYMEAYCIHRAVILFTLLQIYDEYVGYWPLSPKRSELYKQGLAALGAEELGDITIDERIDWLRSLSKHLDEVRRIKSRLRSKDGKKTGYDDLVEQWKARSLPDIADIKHQIEGKIFQLEEEKKQPSFISRTTKSVTASAAAYGFQRVALSFVTEYAIIPTATAAVAGALAGPVGVVVGGLVGPFISKSILNMVSEKIITTQVGNLCMSMLERIGTVMGEAAAAAAFGLFSVSANGMQRLLGYYKEHINDDFDKEWIKTLLELPDNVVSAKDKQKMRKICGLPEPAPDLGIAPKVSSRAPLRLFENYEPKQSNELAPTAAVSLLY